MQNTQIKQKEFCVQLLDDYYDDLCGYDEDKDFYDCDDVFKSKQQKERIEQRYHILKQSYDNNFTISKKNFALSGNTTKVINDFSLGKNAFLTCEGSAYQHAIHKELVSVLDTLGNQHALIQTNKALRAITQNTINFVDIARELNSAAQIKKATFAADLCWALLDYSSAVVEGVTQGAMATVHSFMHPIKTATNIVDTVKAVGYHMAVFVKDIAEITVAGEMHDFDNAHTKSQALVEHIENNIQFLCEAIQETSGRELVRGAAAFATEGYLTGKATHACGKLFTQAKINIVPVLEKVKDTAQKYYKNFNAIPTPEFKYALACKAPEILIAHETAESLILFQESEKIVSGSSVLGGKGLDKGLSSILENNPIIQNAIKEHGLHLETYTQTTSNNTEKIRQFLITEKETFDRYVKAKNIIKCSKNITSSGELI